MSGFRGRGGDGPSRGRGGGGGRGRGRSTRNPYWYFVEEMRVQRRLGTWEQANREVSHLWENLDHSTKQKYISMSKNNRNNSDKLTSTGVSLSSILKEQDLKRKAEEEENNQIETFVKDKSCKITEKEFFVIHSNYYCCTNAGLYPTCEIGIAKFTLEKGVMSVFHSFVHADIPMGYQYDAKIKSEECGIPTPPFEGAMDDYIKIISQLMSYLRSSSNSSVDDSMPPFYAMPDDIKSIKNFLEQLCQTADISSDTFRVYPISKLFFELANNIQENALPHICLALDQLIKDTYTYSRGLACEMHEQGDYFPKCSLSIAKRLCFTICDHCCKFLNINAIPGLHIPNPVYLNPISTQASSRASSSRYANSIQENICSPRSNRSQDSFAGSQDNDDGFIPVNNRSKRRH